MSILPRKEIAEKALKKHGAIIVVSSLDKAIELVNRIAPEHLELAVENPEELLFEVKNAGAVFLGHYTPEAMGDYLAGPNHVLPTMGLARFASALSADKFLKKINFLKYSKLALLAQAKEVITLANAENLFAHAQAVRVRLEENP
jgi:histidinol dehydrogenase